MKHVCYRCGTRNDLISIGQGEYICKRCKENDRHRSLFGDLF